MKNLILIPLNILLGLTPLTNKVMKAAQSYDGKYYDNTKMLDLSDDTESEVDSYYGDIGDLVGDNLMSYLYTKISCSTADLSKYYLDYGSGLSGVGRWYQITDRNWSISKEVNPATFKFVTKQKSSDANSFYLYNMYISDSSNNDKNKAYSNVVNTYSVASSTSKIDYTNYTRPNGNVQTDKEHVWAKNHGFKVKDSKGDDTFVPGAPTDLHHLVAADHNTNSAGHNDYYYGNVNHSKSTTIYSYLADGTTEVSGWLDESNKMFEPTDEWKGDVARCILYMATRYSIKKDVNTQAEPYLKVTDDTSYTDDSNTTFHGVQYHLSDLLEWNEKDPVSFYEKHRNNLIYHNVQNNRNPYVDHPEWARRVYDDSYSLKEYDFSKIDNKTFSCDLQDKTYTLDVTLPSDLTTVSVESDSGAVTVNADKKTLTLNHTGRANLTYTIVDDSETFTYHTTITVINSQLDEFSFNDLKGNYHLHVEDEKKLDVTLPKDLSQTMVTVSDNDVIALADDRKTVTAKKAGTATISYSVTDTSGAGTMVSTTVTVKEKLEIQNDLMATISLKTGETFAINSKVSNAFEDDVIQYVSKDESICEVSNGVLKAIYPGKTTISLVVNGTIVETYEVEVSMSPLMMIAIIVGVTIIILVVIVSTVVKSKKKNKKKQGAKKKKKTYNKKVK